MNEFSDIQREAIVPYFWCSCITSNFVALNMQKYEVVYMLGT